MIVAQDGSGLNFASAVGRYRTRQRMLRLKQSLAMAGSSEATRAHVALESESYQTAHIEAQAASLYASKW